MTDFFQSKFIKDLQDGELPPVEVRIPGETYAYLGLTVVLSALIILIAYTYLKK